MIHEMSPLSMAEASGFIKKKKDTETDVKGFIKKFSEISNEKAKELRKKMEELNLLKLDSKHISKVIDILPENMQELNKIFPDVGLTEDESTRILEEIKKFR